MHACTPPAAGETDVAGRWRRAQARSHLQARRLELEGGEGCGVPGYGGASGSGGGRLVRERGQSRRSAGAEESVLLACCAAGRDDGADCTLSASSTNLRGSSGGRAGGYHEARAGKAPRSGRNKAAGAELLYWNPATRPKGGEANSKKRSTGRRGQITAASAQKCCSAGRLRLPARWGSG